ncbi:putative cation-transporting ATPase 13A5 isoform X3 [Macrotis lagotis]|uniref:putative cation-transporting ATPase 13A5 isoform X3 n=1 Tax=Macrotis lagotis TaxID=92651 RepID=UPI003D69FC37
MGEKYGKGHHAILNKGEENEMEIFGYHTEGCRKTLCFAGYIFSCGILPLVFYWRPAWSVWANCIPCTLSEADVILLRTTDEFQIYSRKKVMWIYLSSLDSLGSISLTPDHPLITDEDYVINRAIIRPDLKVRCIQVQKIRYVWNNSAEQFQKVGCLEDSFTAAKIHLKFGSGLTREEQEIRRLICGSNTIDVEITPIWKLLIKEVLNPFYVFQLFSVCLWFSEDYKEYAVAIIMMSIISITLTVYDLRQQSIKLHRLVESHNSILVTVCKKKAGIQELESRYLVPGDLLSLSGNKMQLPCDAILLDGGCIVNESMLTGESIPVIKTALPNMGDTVPWKLHGQEDYKKHVLFCGTEVIQTRPTGSGTVRAVVLQTGFNTAKGDLVRSILYPKPMNFQLYRDAVRFLLCLIGTATIGMVYTICVYVLSGEPAEDVVKKALDVITIAVPPALPAALTTGIIYAQRRLKKRGIFCISPQRINICGQLNLICFDKTGTLTKDGLDVWGVVPSDRNGFQEIHSFTPGSALPWGPLCGAMASCHSLIILDGTIQGDPLDVKMFEATNWEIENCGKDFHIRGIPTQAMIVKPNQATCQIPMGIAILHQFPFSSTLQRMSVIVQEMEGDLMAFMKGAPERVVSFCQPDTVPSNFTSELQNYTMQGFRVIGLAYKRLETNHHITALPREKVESELTFLGLLILENRLKDETKPVLEELTSARIRTVMVTGDNLQTAVTVARKSGMIPESLRVILIEANEADESSPASVTWKLLEDRKPTGYGDQVLMNATVFARMSPGQKSSLVEEFQKLDYFVGMCGDGANDCGALKVAHAGISLSEQEASVASPFTSKTPNIECVPHLIKEGRAALVTSFCMFKYMALYSMIQYVGVLLLYWKTNSLSNYQFLFQDLAITTLIGITMSLNGAYPKLAPYRPPGRLVSPPLLFSVLLNVLFSLVMHMLGFILVRKQPWYSATDVFSACSLSKGNISRTTASPMISGKVGSDSFMSYENTTIWFLGTINCIIVALVFSKGKPFRQPIYTNYIFVLVLGIQMGVCIFLLFANIPELYQRMDLVCTPTLWRVYLVIMLAVNLILSLIVEEVFGYQTQALRRTLCLLGSILTCGLLKLIFYWRPQWNVWAHCVACPLQEADVVLLRTTDEFQKYTRKPVVCLYLSILKSPLSPRPGDVIVADRHSVINRAVLKPELKVRCIQVQKIRYVWDNVEERFQKVGLLEDSNSCFDIHHTFGSGLGKEEQEIRRFICGPNAIEVQIQPIWKLLVKQVLNPFYVFQAFTLTLWLSQGYIEYSIAIIILTVISIVLSVYDLRQQSVNLHNLVEEHNKIQATIHTKEEGLQELESRLLVPGDILVLSGKFSLPCDAILIDGSCIVNEGMLTGESIPVTKTPLPQAENTLPWKSHSLEDYRRHVLFCGTEVIQTKPGGPGPVRAVVLQTGFNTAKGDLVRSILYPRPLNFQLYNDAFKFIVFLALLGVVAFFYAFAVYMYQGTSARDTVTMSLLLLTVSVPPVLPAALTTGIFYAQKRLKKKKIFCISPQRINMCGQINLICFDKTGTLTEDGLDLWGAVPVMRNCFQEVHSFTSGSALPWGPLCAAMASCHSLIVLDGTIQGDPLDVKMFEGTNWIIGDPSVDFNDSSIPASSIIIKPGPQASQTPVRAVAILHQFPFSSGLQRMSVITQQTGRDHLDAYMKGAPEMVASFCRPETVPSNFKKELKLYTMQGFRVIALAHKPLKAGKHPAETGTYTREEIESELTFLGLLIMENRLKKETKPVLKELSNARIRTVMITGDNLQTAITVAKNSEMIPQGHKVIIIEANESEGFSPPSVTWQLLENTEEGPRNKDIRLSIQDSSFPEEGRVDNYHFAMTGKSYQVIAQNFSSLLPKILVNGAIFARMSPGQKSSLVEEFQKLNYYVGMCGDGANDCGALKMAHAGISLSEQEASVASPFTSKTANIECVPHLIREGRAALVSSFGVFKYLTMYGIIQLIGTALLYWQLQLFGNYQYLMQDVGITLMVCLTMSSTHAYPKLAPYRPAGQLISPPLLLSVFLNTCFSGIVQFWAFLFLKQQPWYCEVQRYSQCYMVNRSDSFSNASVDSNFTTGNGTLTPNSVLSFESTSLWPIVTLNCIMVAFIFSKGKPFRKPVYTNYLFSFLLISALCVTLFIMFADMPVIYSGMEFIPTVTTWRICILAASLVQFCVAFFVEDAILQNRELWLLIKKKWGVHSKSQYRKWQRKLAQDPSWPPMNRTDYSGESKNGFYVNCAYENSESPPVQKVDVTGSSAEQHFWTRL